MSAVEVSIAAASAPLDTNLLSNSPHRSAQRRRWLRAVALKGSAAAGDSAVSVLIGQTEVARLFNSGVGFPNRDDLIDVGEWIESGQELAAVVVDAPATNPLNFLAEFTG